MIRYFITFLVLLCFSCSSYKLALLNHDPMYPVDYVIPVAEETKVDTIDSFFKLKYKLRTDFNFRWDFAQYAMQQPYSWYWNNPRLDGIWRPYNRFDVYFHSNWFWTDWAWNYPYYSFGWNYSYYSWYRPYRPWTWHNQWSIGNQNVAYIYGRRGSRSIQNSIARRYDEPRQIENTLNQVVNELRENFNIKPRVYSNPNNVNINNNSSRPVINNNMKPTYNNSSWSRPSINNVNNNSVNSNFSRGGTSSNISRGSSSSSGGSSRGGRINN